MYVEDESTSRTLGTEDSDRYWLVGHGDDRMLSTGVDTKKRKEKNDKATAKLRHTKITHVDLPLRPIPKSGFCLSS
jgi:hypothetical protein